MVCVQELGKPILTIRDAIQAGSYFEIPDGAGGTVHRGDVTKAMAEATHVIRNARQVRGHEVRIPSGRVPSLLRAIHLALAIGGQRLCRRELFLHLAQGFCLFIYFNVELSFQEL